MQALPFSSTMAEDSQGNPLEPPQPGHAPLGRHQPVLTWSAVRLAWHHPSEPRSPPGQGSREGPPPPMRTRLQWQWSITFTWGWFHINGFLPKLNWYAPQVMQADMGVSPQPRYNTDDSLKSSNRSIKKMELSDPTRFSTLSHLIPLFASAATPCGFCFLGDQEGPASEKKLAGSHSKNRQHPQLARTNPSKYSRPLFELGLFWCIIYPLCGSHLAFWGANEVQKVLRW